MMPRWKTQNAERIMESKPRVENSPLSLADSRMEPRGRQDRVGDDQVQELLVRGDLLELDGKQQEELLLERRVGRLLAAVPLHDLVERPLEEVLGDVLLGGEVVVGG